MRRLRSRCIRCSTCDGFPCLVDAKADAHTVCVRAALAYPNVSLETGALVERLETGSTGGSVTSVVVARDGAEERYEANVVVVSAGAVNSAALLLRSANDRHPQGLANGSDVVGRHYMAHNNSAMIAVSKRKNPTVFQKTLGVNDYYHKSDDFDFPLGHFQMLGKSEAAEFKGDAKFAPGFALEQLAEHALDFWLTSEDLPDPNNRVTVGAGGQISLSYTENNLEGHRRLLAKLKDLLAHAGCETHLIPNELYLGKKIPIAGVAHQNGTRAFRQRFENLGARRELQSARTRQPLRRRRQLLRFEHGREPSPDHHGQRPTRGRPLTRTPRRPCRHRNCGRQMKRATIAFLLFASFTVATPGNARAAAPCSGVRSIAVTVSDLARSEAFYTGVLGFRKLDEREDAGAAEERLDGIFGVRVRRARMALGDETIVLTEFVVPKGREFPADSRANDRWFQHLAIVVSDMDEAYARLRERGVRYASTEPQRLPDWNHNAAGIRAFYFRDPDGHYLELINFPPGKGQPKWQNAGGRLFSASTTRRSSSRILPRASRSTATSSACASWARARITERSRSTSITCSARTCASRACAAAPVRASSSYSTSRRKTVAPHRPTSAQTISLGGRRRSCVPMSTASSPVALRASPRFRPVPKPRSGLARPTRASCATATVTRSNS